MTIDIISPEEIKKKEKVPPTEYTDGYREIVAKSKGFESHAKYQAYLKKKREEKLEEIGRRVEQARIAEAKVRGKEESIKAKEEAIIAKETFEEIGRLVAIARTSRKKIIKESIQKILGPKEKKIIEGNIVTDIRSYKYRTIIPKEATIYDLPISIRKSDIIRNPNYIDSVIIGLRKEYKVLQKKVKDCDSNTLKDICELGKLLDLHNELQGIPSFEYLLKDYQNTKEDFIKGCKMNIKKIKRSRN